MNAENATMAPGASTGHLRPELTRRPPSYLSTVAGVIEQEAEEEEPLLAAAAARRNDSETGSEGYRPQAWNGMVDFEGLPWYKRPHVFWLFVPFWLFTVAFGGMAVPRINIIMTLICREYLADKAITDPTTPRLHLTPDFRGGDDVLCNIPPVHAQLARFNLTISLISGLLAAVTSPKIGALSDRYGRTILIACCTSGVLAGEVLTLMCATYPDKFPVQLIIIGAVIDGLCGGFISVQVASMSYATDCTSPAKRIVTFGWFHGLMAIGMAIGPIAVGYVVELTGTLLSALYLALAAHIIFICAVLFVVPESVSPRRKRLAQEKYLAAKAADPGETSMWKRLRAFNLFEPLKILYPKGPGTSPALRRNLFLLAVVDALLISVLYGVMSVTLIYMKFMFHWTNLEQSAFMSTISSCRVIVLLVILPSVVWFFRPTGQVDRNNGSDTLDLVLIRTALTFDVIGYVGYTLARTGKVFTLSAAVATLGAMGSASLQSALTKHVPADRTGQLLGALGLLHALLKVVAPTTFSLIYSFTVGKFTQTVYVCLTTLFAIAWCISWLIKPHVYLIDSDELEATSLHRQRGRARRREGEQEPLNPSAHKKNVSVGQVSVSSERAHSD